MLIWTVPRMIWLLTDEDGASQDSHPSRWKNNIIAFCKINALQFNPEIFSLMNDEEVCTSVLLVTVNIYCSWDCIGCNS